MSEDEENAKLESFANWIEEDDSDDWKKIFLNTLLFVTHKYVQIANHVRKMITQLLTSLVFHISQQTVKSRL